MKKALFVFITVFIFLVAISASSTQAESLGSGRLLVKFKPSIRAEYKQELFKKHGLSQLQRIDALDIDVLEAKGQKLSSLIRELGGISAIEYAEPDFEASAFQIPNDPYYPSQWSLPKIETPGAWDKISGAGVDIAVVDTGIDSSHEDVGIKVIQRANFTDEGDGDFNGHGTHVAGIAAAVTNNSLGIAGLGADSNLFSAKALDKDGSGYYSWVANAITWSADNGAEVINLSLGGSFSSRTLQDAVKYAWNKGSVIAAAAGNNGNSRRTYPAYYSETIAVAATDQNDVKPKWSSYGSWVDVAAPGVSILSSYKGGYESLSGTSMSTPHVAGLAALVKSLNPSWTNQQVRDKIESSADKINKTGSYWSKGRINACKAVDCI